MCTIVYLYGKNPRKKNKTPTGAKAASSRKTTPNVGITAPAFGKNTCAFRQNTRVFLEVIGNKQVKTV
jgi:Na+-transporting NADH:ubiquinone oxidoreductase subunit NqrA